MSITSQNKRVRARVVSETTAIAAAIPARSVASDAFQGYAFSQYPDFLFDLATQSHASVSARGVRRSRTITPLDFLIALYLYRRRDYKTNIVLNVSMTTLANAVSAKTERVAEAIHALQAAGVLLRDSAAGSGFTNRYVLFPHPSLFNPDFFTLHDAVQSTALSAPLARPAPPPAPTPAPTPSVSFADLMAASASLVSTPTPPPAPAPAPA